MTDRPDHAARDRTVEDWNRPVATRDRAAPGPADAPAEDSTPTLRVKFVRHDDLPDRCTVYPAEAKPDERMVTWLSADADAFVGAEEMR